MVEHEYLAELRDTLHDALHDALKRLDGCTDSGSLALLGCLSAALAAANDLLRQAGTGVH